MSSSSLPRDIWRIIAGMLMMRHGDGGDERQQWHERVVGAARLACTCTSLRRVVDKPDLAAWSRDAVRTLIDAVGALREQRQRLSSVDFPSTVYLGHLLKRWIELRLTHDATVLISDNHNANDDQQHHLSVVLIVTRRNFCAYHTRALTAIERWFWHLLASRMRLRPLHAVHLESGESSYDVRDREFDVDRDLGSGSGIGGEDDCERLLSVVRMGDHDTILKFQQYQHHHQSDMIGFARQRVCIRVRLEQQQTYWFNQVCSANTQRQYTIPAVECAFMAAAATTTNDVDRMYWHVVLQCAHQLKELR